MSADVAAICVTIVVGVIAIALAIYLGLRGFTNSIGTQIDETKDSIVLELSGIKESIGRIFTRVDDVWQLASLSWGSKAAGTIEVQLTHFGKTKVSAEIADKDTTYLIQPERGKLTGDAVVKISKRTSLVRSEMAMFGTEVKLMGIGNTLRVIIPSVDPKLCTDYMSTFLKWLDTEYVEHLKSETALFEKDINV